MYVCLPGAFFNESHLQCGYRLPPLRRCKFRIPFQPLSVVCPLVHSLPFPSGGQNNISPRFEFGFGLSYTTFEYSDLKITPHVHGNEGRLEEAWEKGDVIDHSVGASLAKWWVVLFNLSLMEGVTIYQLEIVPNSPAIGV